VPEFRKLFIFYFFGFVLGACFCGLIYFFAVFVGK